MRTDVVPAVARPGHDIKLDTESGKDVKMQYIDFLSLQHPLDYKRFSTERIV